MLKVSGLCVDYGPVSVLKDLAFSLEPGSFTALLGANGTGKSSLLKGIAGIIPAKGEISISNDLPVMPQQRGSSIAYMPQDTGATSSLTVIEVILLGRLRSLGLQVSQSLQTAASGILTGFGLQTLETRTLDEISGGQRQLVYLAQSLFRNPKILLLDEPTAALDLRHQLIVLDRVVNHCRKNGTIAIAAMHDLSLAAKCADRLICMSQGKIVADGAPDKVLSAPLIRKLYGVEADIVAGHKGVLHITPLKAVETRQASAPPKYRRSEPREEWSGE
ncbi:MAG: ABC transporter ATP-binding protein [Hyphomicrobiales bacterium]|nr:ABC transporter ATP-binding protein [Hyphomicrobiales bacterium]